MGLGCQWRGCDRPFAPPRLRACTSDQKYTNLQVFIFNLDAIYIYIYIYISYSNRSIQYWSVKAYKAVFLVSLFLFASLLATLLAPWFHKLSADIFKDGNCNIRFKTISEVVLPYLRVMFLSCILIKLSGQTEGREILFKSRNKTRCNNRCLRVCRHYVYYSTFVVNQYWLRLLKLYLMTSINR